MKIFTVSSLGLASIFICTAALAKDVVVTQKDKKFSQDEITIAVGDTIVFKNADDTAHNVFSSSEATKFNLGMQKQGTESKYMFTKAGEGEIRCAIHPKMKLKVTVK